MEDNKNNKNSNVFLTYCIFCMFFALGMYGAQIEHEPEKNSKIAAFGTVVLSPALVPMVLGVNYWNEHMAEKTDSINIENN